MICSHCQTPLPDDSHYCLSCGADLSTPGGDRRAVDTVAEIRQLLLGALSGQYVVRDVLGRGGMGTVFLADDLKLDRPVAIKVLPPRLAAEDSFVARFVHEARISAKLEHPHIVPIYAVHSEGGDLPYFVMKYVSGRSLEAVIAEGPLPIDECRRILVEAASALGHAHRKGIVHRDVKPSNIMIDETGSVLLADFGISKALESSAIFTGTGHLVGTPAYMSPEQAKGMKVDGRTDQYSLAVVAHQALTGQSLFDYGSPNAAMYQHVNEPPRSVREQRPDVPEAFANALLRALSKQPAERFASMEDFVAAIRPEGSAPNLPDVRWAVSVKAARGRRLLIELGGAVGLALVLGVVVVLWPRPAGRPVGADSSATAIASPPPANPAAATQPPVVPAARTTPAPVPARSAAPASDPAPRATATRPVADTMSYISINATPYGMLSIDGVDVRNTPILDLPLRPGPHVFRVTRDGYQVWSEATTTTAGNTLRLRPQLIAQP